MATVKAVNRTLADGTDWDHTLKPGKFGGNVKVMVDTYEASALASGSIIEMGGDLPIGAIVLGGFLYYDALGASTTLKVGDAESTARYLAALSTASAGQTAFNLASSGAEYEVDNTTPSTPDTQVLVELGGAAATGTIVLVVFYTHE